MIYGKEKLKLEKILAAIESLSVADELNLEILNDGYREYALIIKALYNKQPNIFGNIYNYELREIKSNKKFIKDSFTEQARLTNFIVYRDSIVNAIERTNDYITSYLQ